MTQRLRRSRTRRLPRPSPSRVSANNPSARIAASQRDRPMVSRARRSRRAPNRRHLRTERLTATPRSVSSRLLACDDGILKTLEMMRVETLESGASTSRFVDRPGPAYKHDQETDMTEQDTSPVEQDSSSVDEGSQQDLTAQDVTKGVPAEEKGDVESTPTTPTSLLEREGAV